MMTIQRKGKTIYTDGKQWPQNNRPNNFGKQN